MKKTNINNSISIIGSGNVATHLALALHSAGHTIRQVLSREFDHASLLASRVSAQPIDRVDRLDSQSDVYLLAVNDDALYDLALDLHLPDALVGTRYYEPGPNKNEQAAKAYWDKIKGEK